jgi:hypothetical protein
VEGAHRPAIADKGIGSSAGRITVGTRLANVESRSRPPETEESPAEWGQRGGRVNRSGSPGDRPKFDGPKSALPMRRYGNGPVGSAA